MKWRLLESAPADGGEGGGGGRGEEEPAGGDEGAGVEDRSEVESKARSMGWKPKSEWKGPTDNWIDAPEYVEKGESLIPFLRSDRQKLQGELSNTTQKLTATEQRLAAAEAALEEIRTFNADMAKERKERRKAEIGAELKAAREAGDDVKVAELQNELGEVIKQAPVREPSKTTTATSQPAIQPWVQSYINENQEFFQDGDRVALFNNEMLRRRKAGDTRMGEVEGVALFNEAVQAVEKKLGGNARRQAASKTEESRRGPGNGSGSSSRGQSYADLPSDARQKCDAQESRFVGEGKTFKDQAAWRKHYANSYFNG